jgi:hypothetical protein
MNPNEDIDKHVLKRYEIVQKLGKGVSILAKRKNNSLTLDRKV